MAQAPLEPQHREKFPRDNLGGQGGKDRPEVKLFLRPPLNFNPYFYFHLKQSRQNNSDLSSLDNLALKRTLRC